MPPFLLVDTEFDGLADGSAVAACTDAAVLTDLREATALVNRVASGGCFIAAAGAGGGGGDVEQQEAMAEIALLERALALRDRRLHRCNVEVGVVGCHNRSLLFVLRRW